MFNKMASLIQFHSSATHTSHRTFQRAASNAMKISPPNWLFISFKSIEYIFGAWNKRWNWEKLIFRSEREWKTEKKWNFILWVCRWEIRVLRWAWKSFFFAGSKMFAVAMAAEEILLFSRVFRMNLKLIFEFFFSAAAFGLLRLSPVLCVLLLLKQHNVFLCRDEENYAEGESEFELDSGRTRAEDFCVQHQLLLEVFLLICGEFLIKLQRCFVCYQVFLWDGYRLKIY